MLSLYVLMFAQDIIRTPLESVVVESQDYVRITADGLTDVDVEQSLIDDGVLTKNDVHDVISKACGSLGAFTCDRHGIFQIVRIREYESAKIFRIQLFFPVRQGPCEEFLGKFLLQKNSEGFDIIKNDIIKREDVSF